MSMYNSGVYIITNTSNNHIYVGSTSDLATRKRHHFEYMKRGIHHSRYLQNAYNKYGEDAFKFQVIVYCDNLNLLLYEQMYIDALKPEYNICKKAGSCLGIKHSEEFKQKMRNRPKRYGMVLSEKHREAIRECNRNRIFSDDTKAKIGKASKERGVSEQCHEARIAKIKGVPLSEEHREKISKANMGKHNYFLGKHHTQEAKDKVRIAKLKYWENQRAIKNNQTNP